jgi:hypothetical protein
MPDTYVCLRRSVRTKSQEGLKRPTMDSTSLLLGDANANLDMMASEPDERERKVKFMVPEVTDVQIFYRVPDEDKYQFYYTQGDIAIFKREAVLERFPTCTDTVTEIFSGMFKQALPPSLEGRQCKIDNNADDDDAFQKEYASCAGRMGFGMSLL